MTTGILTRLIDTAIMGGNVADQENRDYIGASSIGNPCERSIWYRYNKAAAEPFSKKQLRTFAIGKRLEGLVLDCLEQAGVNLARTWYDLADKEIAEFQGHVDAIWLLDDGSPRAIIEVKTARDSSFKIFANRGLKYWYPIYYAQIQAYMGMSGIHEAYVIALNKDTSELHDELVLFDAMYYEDLKRKAQRIIDADEAPGKINSSPMYFVCRGCNFKGICHS
jgi:hypothetical protein